MKRFLLFFVFSIISLSSHSQIIVNPEPDPLMVCDEDNDGFAQFILHDADDDITLGNPTITVTYHLTLVDAMEMENEVLDPYINFNPYNDEVYARAENSDGEFAVVVLALEVLMSPTPTEPTPLEVCDEDNDGFASFVLTQKDSEIGNDDPNLSFTYHETLVDALLGSLPLISPYENIVPFSQTIYVRVSNDLTDCFAVVELELIVNESPPISEPDDLFINEGDGDGFAIFDLTVNIPVILFGLNPSDYNVYFYENEEDAQNNEFVIANPAAYQNITNPQTIYVRVENYDTSCFVIASFEIETDQTISVAAFALENLSISPNPTSESFAVQSSQLVSETTISIYDIQGKLLSSEKILPQNGMLTMNVSTLESGVYFVKIASEGNSAIKKLVKN
ncbi:T9SS type A sorting domain-containing protein [Aequorivita capsosiphonis]|uniref:T9SS type A sorting domain-containing protein n=1 Tax=Aequorivita capsosiphonis TaxID=487317 RepID=UPI00047A8BE5|nr:T9SS type A sorting domain-containing protein [Aequorivita capsosiphonis]